MPEDVRCDIAPARIGPNAILQLIPVLDRVVGRLQREEICRRAGLAALPDGLEMIPEAQAAHLHRVVRRSLPREAAAIQRAAGIGTADYILAHRIPWPARRLLTTLPPLIAAPLLASAIERHAWTFCGSGTFTRVSAWCFQIADNPLVRSESAEEPICDWHSAVFTRLYQSLVARNVLCRETACCAAGGGVCRFELAAATGTGRRRGGTLFPLPPSRRETNPPAPR